MKKHQLEEFLLELLEEYFPKDKAKERGAAIVMIAEILQKVSDKNIDWVISEDTR